MQSKLDSFIEAWSSTAVGFALSFLVQQFVINPLFELKVSFVENLAIVAIFTVVSVTRSYFVRRFFNMKHKDRV